jgi:DNA-binding NarL/FixJ family response regulator
VKRVLPEAPPPSVIAYEIQPGRVLVVHDLPTVSKLPGLGEAEQEIVELLLRGHDNRSIAKRRGTSPRTVENQISSIFRKLDVRSRAELMAKLLDLR